MARPSTYIALVLVAIAVVVAFYSNRQPSTSGVNATTVEGLAKEGHYMEQAWPEHSQLIGQPMPSLELSRWVGPALSRGDMAGRILVVDFWATWCPPCRAAIPHNNEIARKYADRGVLLIGACGGGGEDKMPEVAKSDGIGYPTAVTTAASIAAWRVKWFPTYAIVDRRGLVRAIGIRPEYLEPIIEALLKEETATRPAATTPNDTAHVANSSTRPTMSP